MNLVARERSLSEPPRRRESAMTKPISILLLLVLTLAAPRVARAQGFGMGVRAGSLGFGGEAALGLTRFLAVRGGIGYFPLEVSLDYSGVDYSVTLPSGMATVGIDLYPTGRSFRLMAGFLARHGDTKIESGDLGQGPPVQIGDSEYDQAGVIKGVLKTESTAPFFGIGLGRHTAPGFGVSLDVGVALVGKPQVELSASGPISEDPRLAADLQKEERNIQEDAKGILEYWPVLSLGIKIPLR